MPSTHSSLHYHLVFSTKDRFPHIVKEWRCDLHAYLGGCLRVRRQLELRTADLMVAEQPAHARSRAARALVVSRITSTCSWEQGRSMRLRIS